MKHYIESKDGEMNYVMDLLVNPSNKWFINAIEDRKRLRKPNVVKYCYDYNREKKFRKINEWTRDKLHQFTAVISEGKEIELYDRNDNEWNTLIVKKHIRDSEYILYDLNKRIHKTLDLSGLTQIA